MKILRVSSLGVSIVLLSWLFYSTSLSMQIDPQLAETRHDNNSKTLVVLYVIFGSVIGSLIKIMKDVYDE